MEDKKLLQLVSDIGFDMLSYGGEIYRVEETVKRICFAYGIEIVDVFAIPSTISVSITRQEETYSRTRRIISKGTDLDKVDQLNNLSRQLCREKPDYISAKEMLRQIRTGTEYPLWMLCCAHGAAALIFALFFGGNWKDGLWAFPIGIMIKLVSYGMGKLNANSFFVTVICGALSALMAGFGAQLHILDQVSHVLMGAIMNLSTRTDAYQCYAGYYGRGFYCRIDANSRGRTHWCRNCRWRNDAPVFLSITAGKKQCARRLFNLPVCSSWCGSFRHRI